MKKEEILLKLSAIPKGDNLNLGKSLGLFDYWECKCGRMIHLRKFEYGWGVEDLHSYEIWQGGSDKVYSVFNLLKEFYKQIHGENDD